MVTVRPAAPDDRPRIRECHVAAVRESGPDAYDERQVAAWADTGEPVEDYPVESDGHYLVVAELHDVTATNADVVGYGHLVPTEGEIRAVYVHPDAGGRSVGSALLDALEARARDLRLDSLSLTASLNAVDFYEQAGYERAGRDTYSTIHDGETVELDIEQMTKRL
ncbi:GNAT family N-acetyltransferase [Halobacterium jilantaiense]|uniref:Acetyltransferase (GNAT) domain-containing protein n=1 Tax=Halobacterium jilantaiense TaxID=355548 RepID=A0A1I0MLI6_9EURY|nr:GNAT family N-acetyltransferase [Halobacterium jilantaiense]SEV89193.1 Acetyltransferase (GNAT) domain-containing protein [Halobacterium jilantaiense]